MPRTRSKNTKITASVTRKVNYRDNSDSSDDDQDDPGILTNLLGLLMNMQRHSAQKKNRRKTTPKAGPKGSKRKQSTGGCDCPHCSLVTPKKRCTARRAQPKGKAKSKASSTFVASNESFNLESDDEVVAETNITETQETAIKNKVDTFFKALDSDDDESESKSNINLPAAQPAEKKSKDFYTILTDSEDEKEKPCTSTSTTSSFAEPSTSGSSNIGSISGLCIINTGLKRFSQAVKIPEKNPEDLFAYVDEILNECDIVDITSDKHKENIPEMSLEDLKKKTDEIVGGVQSFIDDFKSTPKAPETKTLEKDVPTCPICLENLGGSTQTMATFCGHMFCEPCIAQVARTSKKCPTCRKGVTKTKYHPVYI